MSTLKEPGPNFQSDQEPAIPAGIFLESISIFPYEMQVLNGAITRIAELRHRYDGNVQQVIRSYYDPDIPWQGPLAIDLYTIR